jgi:hypothetical protein
MFTRRKLLGKQLGGAKSFAASPDPAAAGSALRAHFSRGREKCGLVLLEWLRVPNFNVSRFSRSGNADNNPAG